MSGVYSIIQQLCDEKKFLKKLPDYVLYSELSNMGIPDLREQLNQLYKDGLIEVGATLNDKWIRIKE